MPQAPWNDPDLDDYKYSHAPLEGAGDWDSDPDLLRSITSHDAPIPFAYRRAKQRPVARRTPELEAPLAARKRFRILEGFKGQTYARTESGWSLNGVPFTFEPITGRLDNQLLQRLAGEDRETDDPAELVRRAWFGQALEHHDRVVDLTRRAIRSVMQTPDPNDAGAVVPLCWRHEALAAAAMSCSAHRHLRAGERALEETELFASSAYPPLMTSRSAAMCDVGRWDEARDLALRARDLQASEEVISILSRIDRHFSAETAATTG